MQGAVEVTRTLGAAVGHNGRGEKRRPLEPYPFAIIVWFLFRGVLLQAAQALG